ncbi:hypothetical protein SAMN02982929_06623 [Saccharopolyspora kobensis]|uniref:VOC domain-containing protein n=1 Tax=Saccharopolyspora kobensis TaxID=146035 RepID=A0A1H6EJK3_9PSEU|nr:VOC family protein [Saccharopolyspora kobensis]SEG97039.1 hypothetical protein SAMN02982929_06623 [Saccharopolyspora kobensis]SFE65776.1 hypothetical protein SAMN05216506_11379 [Saccharopolyspora kobensis]
MTIEPIIITSDIDRLQGFYRAVFGAEESSRVPAEGTVFFLGLQVRGAGLGLVQDDAAEPGEPGRVLLNFFVDDVDEVLARVAPAGGEVLGPPNDMPWGQRVAHVKDPDGNAVNLTQPI